MLLKIQNLHARVEGAEILHGLDLEVRAGEVHAIMGPNGSGKSTLAGVLAGRDVYEVTEGKVLYEGRDLLDLDPKDRAREGLFLAFQYPVEIPGVSNLYFLRAALNAKRKHQGLDEMDAMDFLALVRDKMKLVEMDETFLHRSVNNLLNELRISHIRDSLGMSLSGGERRRGEIARALAMRPRFILLDEPFAGVDPISVIDIQRIMSYLRGLDIGVLITDHNVRETLGICERAYIMSEGQVVAQGGAEAILANAHVRKVYLG